MILVSEQTREVVLSSLKFPDMNGRFNGIVPAESETFSWILSSNSEQNEDLEEGAQSFVDWLLSDEKIYWISGKAGSGKSTIMKYIVEHLQEQDLLKDKDSILLFHFFLISGNPLQRNMHGLFGNILRQLWEQDNALLAWSIERLPT